VFVPARDWFEPFSNGSTLSSRLTRSAGNGGAAEGATGFWTGLTDVSCACSGQMQIAIATVIIRRPSLISNISPLMHSLPRHHMSAGDIIVATHMQSFVVGKTYVQFDVGFKGGVDDKQHNPISLKAAKSS
jgi:hypothetical protein